MNHEELQKQIDSRCPCFALPLEECQCEFNEEPNSLLIPWSCPHCGEPDWQNSDGAMTWPQRCHHFVGKAMTDKIVIVNLNPQITTMMDIFAFLGKYPRALARLRGRESSITYERVDDTLGKMSGVRRLETGEEIPLP